MSWTTRKGAKLVLGGPGGGGSGSTAVTDHGLATDVVGMAGVGDLIMDHLDQETLGRARGVSKTWRDAVDAHAASKWRRRERSMQALMSGGALVWDGGRVQAHDSEVVAQRRFFDRSGLQFYWLDDGYHGHYSFSLKHSQCIDPTTQQFYQLDEEGQRVPEERPGQPSEWVNVCLARSGPVLLVGDQAAWGGAEDLGRIFDLVPWFNTDRHRYVWAGCVRLAEWETVQPYLAQSCKLFPEGDAPKPNWSHVLWLDDTMAVGPLPALSEADWTAGHRLLG